MNQCEDKCKQYSRVIKNNNNFMDDKRVNKVETRRISDLKESHTILNGKFFPDFSTANLRYLLFNWATYEISIACTV